MRYFATRLNGDGTESLIADWLTLKSVSITRTLSGVNAFSATLEPEDADLIGPDGLPILLPWSSAIYAEDENGDIVHGTIVTSLKSAGKTLSITGTGFLGLMSGMAWVDKPMKFYNADPADLMRLLWAKMQSRPGGNLGVVLSTLKTPTDLGVLTKTPTKAPAPTKTVKNSTTSTATIVTTTTKETTLYKDRNVVLTIVTREVTDKKTKKTTTTRTETTKTTYATKRVVTVTKTYTGSKLTNTKTTNTTLSSTEKVLILEDKVTKDEPYVFSASETTDMGQKFTDLAEAASLDYRESHRWAEGEDRIIHLIEFGYPRLGARRQDILFDTEINITEIPELTMDAEDYASAVVVLGAGEGDKMIRGSAEAPHPARLRRVKSVERKGIGRQETADKTAADLLKSMGSDFPLDISSVTVVDSDLAPMGSWRVGDEVLLVGPAGWAGDVEMYVRIMEESFDPEEHTRSLSITRADRT